ncbi:MAG: DUF523 domain-containing protein [Desulfuromonas sp.]|nr:DUF523 domain-containing protein [Desulfuromonas sp.]
MKQLQPVLVSACLLGLNTRYDGQTKQCRAVKEYLEQHQLLPIPICPEQLGGLTTPRCASSFKCGDGLAVVNGTGALCTEIGQDVTANFLSGAQQSLLIAQLTGCSSAIFKQRSPSCGVNFIYQGQHIIAGQGVTTALLAQHGITIISEEDLAD